MSEPPPISNEIPPEQRDHRHRWDALGVIIASLVGLLALVVAGYTAYIQREQVRAQVWPYLISGNNDLAQALTISNKGVGPAIVRSVQVDRKSTRLNSSHHSISYAVFCLKKK